MNNDPNFVMYGKPYIPDSDTLKKENDNSNNFNKGNPADYTSSEGKDFAENLEKEFSDSVFKDEFSSTNFENENNGNDFDNPKPSRKKNHKNREPKFVTRRCFVITIICCMIATSALTVLGMNFISGLNPNKISATNYTLAKATGSEKSVEEIVAANQDAVVEIKTESVSRDSFIQNYVTQGAGSGVIIDTNGYILTCNHVIENASKITVTLKNGKDYAASIVGTDPQTDVAVLKINGSGFSAAKYGNVKDLSVGDLAVAIGNPLGELGGSASTGIISSLSRELEIDGKTMTLLQTDASINPGNSGGGLFDGYGNLIGIVVAKSTGSDVEGLGFAIPINKAADIAKQLIENGKVTDRAVLGIKVLNATDADTAREYNLDAFGIYVAELVSPESKESGLQVGDRIIALDGIKVSRLADLAGILEKHKPGEDVKIEIVRDNDKKTYTIKLSEAQ